MGGARSCDIPRHQPTLCIRRRMHAGPFRSSLRFWLGPRAAAQPSFASSSLAAKNRRLARNSRLSDDGDATSLGTPNRLPASSPGLAARANAPQPRQQGTLKMKRLLLLTTAALGALAAPGTPMRRSKTCRSPAASAATPIPGNCLSTSLAGRLSAAGDAQHPWAEQCSSGADHDIDPRQLRVTGRPIGFRANDGTDYFDLDQAYPISTNGWLFDVGTTTARWGLDPLFAIWSEGTGYAAAFTGNVGGTEYYNLQGSATASATGAVPEPSTWAMGLASASRARPLRAGGRAGRTGRLSPSRDRNSPSGLVGGVLHRSDARRWSDLNKKEADSVHCDHFATAIGIVVWL